LFVRLIGLPSEIRLGIFLSRFFGFRVLRGRILACRIFFVVFPGCRIFLGGFFVVLVVFLFLGMRFVFWIFRVLVFLFFLSDVMLSLVLERVCCRSFHVVRPILLVRLLGRIFLCVGFLVRWRLRIEFVC